MSSDGLFQFEDEESARHLYAQLKSLGAEDAALIKRDAHTGQEFYEVILPILLAGTAVIKTWIRERAATRRATRFRLGGLEINAFDPESAEELISFLDAIHEKHQEDLDPGPTAGST